MGPRPGNINPNYLGLNWAGNRFRNLEKIFLQSVTIVESCYNFVKDQFAGKQLS